MMKIPISLVKDALSCGYYRQLMLYVCARGIANESGLFDKDTFIRESSLKTENSRRTIYRYLNGVQKGLSMFELGLFEDKGGLKIVSLKKIMDKRGLKGRRNEKWTVTIDLEKINNFKKFQSWCFAASLRLLTHDKYSIAKRGLYLETDLRSKAVIKTKLGTNGTDRLDSRSHKIAIRYLVEYLDLPKSTVARLKKQATEYGFISYEKTWDETFDSFNIKTKSELFEFLAAHEILHEVDLRNFPFMNGRYRRRDSDLITVNLELHKRRFDKYGTNNNGYITIT